MKKIIRYLSVSVSFLLIFIGAGMENDHKKKQINAKETLLVILQEINNNNVHILANGYPPPAKEELVVYAQLNASRTKDLQCEEECTPLTIPALIVLNKKIKAALTKYLPNDEHATKHEELLNQLKNLKKQH